MENDVGSIDFANVQVTNQTALWLIPYPFAFDQWFPHTALAQVNGVLYAVKDQHSGVSYHVSSADNVTIASPKWAAFTAITAEYLVLTVYSPSDNRGRAAMVPATYRLAKGKAV
ncbi:hypothetical protein ACO0LM_00765 [Undibacterium sp. Di26W]|uniref:hypothetical protein n=1 Tax=Undibacterium sp. Di26W TaxID=3413035 RepID=UPI003BF34FD3